MYLKHTAGKASLNILRMALPEISFELRNAIHHAIKTKKSICKKGIELIPSKKATAIRIIELEVSPLKLTGEEPLLMVVFTERQLEIGPTHSGGKMGDTSVKDRRIKKLEQELAAARSDMGSITHDQESVNEELQVANEAVVSSNEELQSLNEELETSKEEIESANEELTTSNQELFARNQEVEKLYTYYEAILSTVQEPMLILDEGIKIKSANKSFYSTFQVTESASVGQSLYKIGNNQWNIPRLRLLLEDILPKKSIITNFEVEHDFPLIGQKSMLLNAHRILNLGNNEELIVLTILDITEVRKLKNELAAKEKLILEKQIESEKEKLSLIEASNKRYNMMLMQSPFAFAILKGKDHIIALANDSIKTIWGKGDRIEGKPLITVLPELKKGSIPKLLNKVYTSGIAYLGYEELIPLTRNGILENMYFNFVYQPYKEVDESISGVVIIAYDVTSQVITKEALKEAKIIAESKTQIAETAMASKQQFLSNMSHEIRTPMNAIVGFTSALLKSELTAKQREQLSAIKTSGNSLILLINDILDLAKVDSGKMGFEKKSFSLRSSINSIAELFQPKIEENNLDFYKEYDPEIPPVIIGDQMHLRQILSNLLSNAIKFTHNGKISLKVRLLKVDSEIVTIEFSISDTGIGIAKENLTSIFEIFQQATKGMSRQYGGTGLGLAIVKQLVETQGGKIKVESTLNKGSTFSFTLDFQKSNDSIEPETQSLELYPKKNEIKVLVAEDVALNQLLIKTLLDDFGCETDIAGNGKIAIEKMSTKHFDIILMDLHMPEMDGFETTEYIRHKLNSSIPIIALTADVTTVDVTKCKAVGMNDYISKPIDENLLYKKIMALVSTGPDKDSVKKEDITPSRKAESKYTDLTYLLHKTKGDPKLMTEIISLYLNQTPPLLHAMKQHLREKNWDLLHKAVHKLIPSFAIMGMGVDIENVAKKIQESSQSEQSTDELPDLVKQLDSFCKQAFKELKRGLILIEGTEE